MRKLIGGLFLSAALLVPVAMQAKEHRYYDREHKDHHEWNDGENRAYNRYLEERKEDRRRDFNRENQQRQRAYWQWRHNHSDIVLFPR
jgi:type III secretory pathway component EscR